LIENLSVVSGNPDYSVTVTASLSIGNYVLASGAATFNSTISVCNATNTCFGSISLNGNTVTYSGKTYSLNNSNGNLTLQVVQSAAPEPPPQSGNVFVYSSGTVVSRADEVSGIVLNNGEYTSMKVSSGGTARDTTILSGGHAYVYKGGEAHNTKISSWGNFYVNGGCAYNTEISSASVYASAGGVLSNTTAYYQGGLRLSNGSAINNTLSRGYIYAYNGALADSTVVHSGGNIYLYNKGIVQNTQINSGGKLYISSGGTHKGSLQIENGATVSAYKGAKIDFTLSGRTEADDYLINNLSLIKGAPSYTISVASDQTNGTYKLAQGASALTGTFSISSGATVLGNISVNGNILEADGKTYDLNNVNGDLTLTISTPIQSIFTAGNFNGSGGIFEWKSNNTAYIRNQTEKTQISGTLNVSDWTLLGAGDFNRSGSDGLLWMEKASGNVYIQNDLDSFDEITNKTNCLGCAGEGYTILSTGDFTGTGIAGVVMQGPAFGDESISLNYGLPIWGREADGSTFPGWLGALVNTWQPGQTLKGNPADAADINANNYMYEVVAVGDYNGDGTDDVMLQNIMPTSVNGITITGSGDVFTFLTGNIDAVKNGVSPIVAYAGCASGGWKIAGSGDFDGDGTTDTLLSDGTGVAGWKMIAGQRAGDQWFGTLAAGQEIAGIADLNNDGIDDILLCDRATGICSGWLVQNGAVTGTLAIA
jgi:autotransporter passenger strand-loop-strand repeat protein